MRDIPEQEIRLRGLDKISAVHRPRHVAGQRKNRRVIAARLVEPGHQVRAAWTGRAGAHPKLASQLCLASGGQSCAFLMTDADPIDLAASDGVREWIERVADQPEDMSNPDLLKHANQKFCNCC